MLNSIYTGVSGIQSHQTRMDVIGNNVANVNTVGFKMGRATFQDIMYQTREEAIGPEEAFAGTNPVQIGLGVKIGSVDTLFTQGALQTTGKETDLAVKGEGFFILSDGQARYYTRDGAFSFNSKGRLIDPVGALALQGYIADSRGTLGSEVGDITVPFDREVPGKATTQVRLSGNLDASGQGKGEPVWTQVTRFGTSAQIVGTAAPTLDLSGGAGTIGVKVSVRGETFESSIEIPARNYANLSALVAEINAQIAGNGTLKGKLFAKADPVGGLIIRTVSGGDDVNLELTDPDNVGILAAVSIPPAPQLGTLAITATMLNDLANVAADLDEGDLLRFYGTKPNGDRFDGTFLYQADATLEELLTEIQTVYGGVTAGIDDKTGRIVLTDGTTNARIEGFDLTISLLDNKGEVAAGVGNASGLFGDVPPFEFSASSVVYDEKGAAHTLVTTFTQKAEPNQWSWTASVDGITPSKGHNGLVIFDETGKLQKFESVDNEPLAFEPGGGAATMVVNLSVGDKGDTERITEFVGKSSVAVREQDGRAAGKLDTVMIDTSGKIVGRFTNGATQVLAQVLLADFNNSAGLRASGGNMFMETVNSGEAIIGTAKGSMPSEIVSGALELSNVDLAREFTNMIVTQRGFQANARTITTASDMMIELVNLKQ